MYVCMYASISSVAPIHSGQWELHWPKESNRPIDRSTNQLMRYPLFFLLSLFSRCRLSIARPAPPSPNPSPSPSIRPTPSTKRRRRAPFRGYQSHGRRRSLKQRSRGSAVGVVVIVTVVIVPPCPFNKKLCLCSTFFCFGGE